MSQYLFNNTTFSAISTVVNNYVSYSASLNKKDSNSNLTVEEYVSITGITDYSIVESGDFEAHYAGLLKKKI